MSTLLASLGCFSVFLSARFEVARVSQAYSDMTCQKKFPWNDLLDPLRLASILVTTVLLRRKLCGHGHCAEGHLKEIERGLGVKKTSYSSLEGHRILVNARVRRQKCVSHCQRFRNTEP